MGTTLYRKYRPARWADVVGQEHVVRALTHELSRNTIVHAYLFTGPRGVGKTTSARLFAKAVNCTGRGELPEPCNTCENCVAYSEGRTIDIIEIDAASHTGVDMVREHVIENARFMPTRAAYKVFIIDEVHMLSTSAFNALLKTLEEPPSHALFILATTEVHKLLATIRSRCEEYTFRRVAHEQIVARLQSILQEEQRVVAPDVLMHIASLSEGCLRDAESLLGQVLSLKDGEITRTDCEHILPKLLYGEGLAIVQAIAAHDAAAGLTVVSHLYDASIDFYTFMTQLIELVHAVILVKYKATQPDTLAAFDASNVERMGTLATQLSPTALVRMVEVLMRAREATPAAPLPHLPLEMAIVELCDTDDCTSPSVPATPPRTTPPPTPKTPPVPMMSTPKPRAATPPSTAEPTKDTPDTPSLTLSLEDILMKWHTFVDAVGQQHASLTFSLKTAEPSAVEGGKLILAFPYSLHADKVREMKTKRLTEDLLKAFYGQRIELDCVVKNMVQQGAPLDEQAPVDPAIADLAAAFGGTVVE